MVSSAFSCLALLSRFGESDLDGEGAFLPLPFGGVRGAFLPSPFGGVRGRRRGGRELDIDFGRCELRARLALRFGGDFDIEGRFSGCGFSEESAGPLAPLRATTCKQAPLMATTCAGDASGKIATHPAPVLSQLSVLFWFYR